MSVRCGDVMGRENRLIGNWGEQYISEKLSSQDCFVRHVPQGHDTGIDLYCETTSEDKRPFLHFWCQVKVKSQERLRGKASKITFSPTSLTHVGYWLSQPVPVFIFIVPDLRKKNGFKQALIPFYIFCAIDFYNGKGKIESLIKIQGPKDLENFLNIDLLTQTFRWDLMRGRVSHLPTPLPSYTIEYPVGQTLNFEGKLEKSLRWTLRLLADDILAQNDSKKIAMAKPYVEMLEILASARNDKHYDTYEVIGKYYHSVGRFQEALENYKKSLKQLHNDYSSEISRNDRRWKTVFERIELAVKELEARPITPMDFPVLPAGASATLATAITEENS